jgi:hypothetical protein
MDYKPRTRISDGITMAPVQASDKFPLGRVGSTSPTVATAESIRNYVLDNAVVTGSLTAPEINNTANVLLCKTSGNVLIGTTTNMGTKFQVIGDVLYANGNASTNSLLMTSITDARVTLDSYNGNGTVPRPLCINTSFTGSNVLIGTTSDDGVNKLQVVGSLRVTGPIIGNGTVHIEAATALRIDQTTSGAAGAVAGYININVNGTAYKLPYHTV